MVEQLAPQGRSQLSHPSTAPSSPFRDRFQRSSCHPANLSRIFTLSLLQCACLKRWSRFSELLNKSWVVGGLQTVSCSYYYYKPAYYKYELLNFSKSSPTSSPSSPPMPYFYPTQCAVSLYVSMRYDGGCCLAFVYLLFSLLRASFSFESLASCLGWEAGGLVQERVCHRWISCGSIMFCLLLMLSVPVQFLIITADIDERISITPAKFKSTR